jgi:hypothetical protein
MYPDAPYSTPIASSALSLAFVDGEINYAVSRIAVVLDCRATSQGHFSFWAIGIPERLGELAAEVEALVRIDAVEPLVGLEQGSHRFDRHGASYAILEGRLACYPWQNAVP